MLGEGQGSLAWLSTAPLVPDEPAQGTGRPPLVTLCALSTRADPYRNSVLVDASNLRPNRGDGDLTSIGAVFYSWQVS